MRRWRTQKRIVRFQLLEHRHLAAAARAFPGERGRGTIGSCDRHERRGSRQQLKTKGQKGPAPPAGEKTIVANTHEAVGEDMQEEAAQELRDRKFEFALLVAVSGVPPAEGDLVLLEIDDAMVGNGDTVGVAAQVFQNMIGAAERRLAVDYPVLPKQ